MSEVTNDLLSGLLDELSCNDSGGELEQPKTTRRRPRAQREGEGESRLIALARTIEGQIVPRLIMARGAPAMDERSVRGRRSHEEGSPVQPDDVEELVRLLLGHDSTVASAFVATVEHRGVRLETICMHLLGPAARRLGDLWNEDRADLMQVTLALCRLQTLLRELSLSTRNTTEYREHRESILLVPAPGEQHTFGLQLIAEFFRRASWDVWLEFPSTTDELLDIVSRQSFSVVGLSVGAESRFDGLATRIKMTRRASRNKALGVMIGGRAVTDHPEAVHLLGADAGAGDGRQAPMIAERLVKALETSH